MKNMSVEKMPEKKLRKIVLWRKPILISLGLASAVLIGLFAINPTNILYNQYAEHTELQDQSKGDSDPLFREASQQFNEEDYAQAEVLLKKLTKNYIEDVEILFCLGITYIENNKSEKALEIFQSEKIMNSSFKEKSEWYQALVYLKQNKIEECKIALTNIQNSSSYYPKSSELFETLE